VTALQWSESLKMRPKMFLQGLATLKTRIVGLSYPTARPCDISMVQWCPEVIPCAVSTVLDYLGEKP
jgi:hypothetical protein